MRNFSRAVAVLFLAGIVAAQTAPNKGYETVKVADGVYAFIDQGPLAAIVSGNSIVIIGDEGALVVDSGMYPSYARQQIAEIRQWTQKPVRALVNTHWHWDHLAGNPEYRAAFPGLLVLSTNRTRESILKFNPPYYQQAANYGALLAAMKNAVATGKGRSGKPISPDKVRELQNAIPLAEAHLNDFTSMKFDVPDMGFDQSVSLWLGKREVRIMFLGRGNTAGDAVIYVPDSKTLITGDLVVAPYPYGTSPFMGDWIKTLDKLMAFDTAAVVPGHGPVMRDFGYIKRVKALLESVMSQVRDAVAKGLSLEDTQKQVNVSSFDQEFCHGDARCSAYFNEYFTSSSIERAYKEVKGTLPDEEEN